MTRWQALVLAILAAATLIIAVVHSPVALVPACEEDQVIVGTGDFHGRVGGWDVYTCVALDNLNVGDR